MEDLLMRLNIMAALLFLIAAAATVGCATSGDVKRLKNDSNARHDHIRQELALIRASITSLQRDIQATREGKAPLQQRLEQEMEAITREVAKTNRAVLLMGKAVEHIAQLVEPSVAPERPPKAQ
jgi:hypothetical protein